MIDWTRVEGFDWDAGNQCKGAEKHAVSQTEAEQVFFNQPLLVVTDERHSLVEQRFHALGRTDGGRQLHVTFTLRQNEPVSASSLPATCIARNVHVMSKKHKPVPTFSSEAEERHFWETHDSSAYIDWSKAEPVRLPNLKPSTTSISLRLPLTLLEQIKVAANKRDMPYQSLIKAWLSEKVDTR